VHVHGTLHAHRDQIWLERIVRDLTARHEAALPAPWAVDDAPADYLERMLRAIVGVSLDVDRVEAKRKLSQNRTAPDVVGVVAGLRARGDVRSAQVADAMADVVADMAGHDAD
jgi:transcriptional regulator